MTFLPILCTLYTFTFSAVKRLCVLATGCPDWCSPKYANLLYIIFVRNGVYCILGSASDIP